MLVASPAVVSVVRATEALAERWDAFVTSAQDGSPYHLFAWKRINERCFGHRCAYLAAIDDREEIAGVLPIVQLKSRLFGNIACSMPFVNYGGLCAVDEGTRARLIEEARSVADEWKVEYLEIRTRQLIPGLPGTEHKVSMTIDLDPDPEVLFKAYKSGHRQDIRRGYRNGAVVRHGGPELLDDFYSVLSESWRDLGTPLYHPAYFRTIAAAFPELIRVTVVYCDDEPAAAAFDTTFGDRVEGMWLGSQAKYRTAYAGYVLYWELIKDACERGFKRFHLGRSTTQSGGEMFKKKWNAYPSQLHWQYLLRSRTELPRLDVSNPKYRLAMQAWRRLPVFAIRAIGPTIARSIP